MKTLHLFETRLAAAGNGNSRRSVEELAAHVLGCRPLEIYFRDMTPEQTARLEALVARAEQGEPIQYLIGHVDFRGLEIRCDRRALIPRPETELLVEAVLSRLEDRNLTLEVADVCCGTGCIGLALAHELPNAQMTAVDLSPEALSLAGENAERLGMSGRFRRVNSDLLSAFSAEGAFDLVVSNPPYIASAVCRTLDRSVRDFEPMLALDGGVDGLDLIRRLAGQSFQVLKPGGLLFLEIGFDQGDSARRIVEESGFSEVRVVKDLAGLDRVVSGMKVESRRSEGRK